jgi:hypothetical protein
MTEKSNTAGTLSLATKLAKIMGEIAPIDKSGRNQKQGYAFIEYADVAASIRKLLSKYSVMVLPQVSSYERTEIESKTGMRGFHYVINMTFLVVNGDNPEDRIERSWVAEGADYGDKGINKSVTAGEKYFLMRLFNVSEKGERDADSDSPTLGEAKPIRQPSGSNQAVSRASQKQIDFLKTLLTKAGKPEAEIADTIKKAQVSNSAQVSMWIEKARELAEGAGND